MNQFLLVLVTALVTGVVSFTGIWFGSNLTRGNEDLKWRREHALEAYSNYIRLIDTIIHEASKAYRAECGTEELRKSADILVEKLNELHLTSDRIILLSTTDLQKPFSDLSRFVPELAEQYTTCPKIPKAQAAETRSKLAELQASFMMNARNDLGVHPRNQEWNQKSKSWSRF